MLPNHSPLMIAEQFGTLAASTPAASTSASAGRPGSDQATMRALRRDATSADRFPQDVLELQGYLAGGRACPGVQARPGQGHGRPLYILGSSLYGAPAGRRCSGCRTRFASHFAPAGAARRPWPPTAREFRPSAQLDGAVRDRGRQRGRRRHRRPTRRSSSRRCAGGSSGRCAFAGAARRSYTDEQADAFLASPRAGPRDDDALHRGGHGGRGRALPGGVRRAAGADEVIVAHHGVDVAARLRSVELAAAAAGLATPV